MNVSYETVLVRKPATEADVLELLRKIEADEARLDSIKVYYGKTPKRDPEYERIAAKIRNAFSLAESYWAEIEARNGK
jgi:hypothetical protein